MAADRPHWISYVFRALIVIVLLMIGGGLSQFLTATAPKPKKADPERTLQKVNVFAAKKVDVRRQWTGFGTAEAIHSADVPARINAVVTKLDDHIRAGRFVKQGDVLALLDDSDFKRQLEVADEKLKEVAAQKSQLDIELKRLKERLALETEDLTIARQELANVQMRVDRGAANERELDQPKRAVIAARRAMVLTHEALDQIPQRRSVLEAMERGFTSSKKLAQLSVNRAVIKSPIDGIIESVDIERGENVTSGQRIARIVNLNEIEVPLRLAAAARQDVIVGSSVSISKTHNEPVKWQGKIARILPVDETQARSTVVIIEIKQPYANESYGQLGGRNLLTPGMFVTGMAQSATSAERWVVPRRSIINQRVWTVSDQIVKSVPVDRAFLHEGAFPQLQVQDDQWAVLSDDAPLEPGALIIINASTSVSDGQKIKPVQAKPKTAGDGKQDDKTHINNGGNDGGTDQSGKQEASR